MTKIKDRRAKRESDTHDFFDDDFEVIYEDDLDDLLKNSFIEDDDEPDDYYYDDDEYDTDDYDDEYDDEYDIDDYDDDFDSKHGRSKRKSSGKSSKSGRSKDSGKGKASSRKDAKKAKKDKDDDNKKDNSKKKHSVPNVVSPAAKTGTRMLFKVLHMILKAASLILIAVIIYLLASTFGKNCSTYGNPLLITEEKNYILMAYLGTAGVLIFYEVITFFWVLMGRGKQGHDGQNQDTGRGLFSFLFIGVTSILASILYMLIPVSPEALEGLQGALMVYGSLCKTLLPICIAGAISCLLRRFVIR